MGVMYATLCVIFAISLSSGTYLPGSYAQVHVDFLNILPVVHAITPTKSSIAPRCFTLSSLQR